MALIFLFALASVGLMVKMSIGGWSFATGMAIAVFAALAIGVFVGALVQARRWENER